MKKIVHMSSAHPMTDVRIFFKECQSLKKAGYDVSLIAQADKDDVIEGIKICAVPKTTSRLKRMTLTLYHIYKRAMKEKADLYHFHDPELILLAVVLRLQGKKIIYDVHEDLPRDILLKTWLPSFVRPFLSRLLSLIEYSSAKIFNQIVTVTPHIQKRFEKMKSVEVRNYPIIDEFEPSSEEKLGICYAGLMTPERGIHQMVEVAKETQLSLMLAGHFTCGSLRQNILSNRFVNYLGYVNRMELNKLYQQSLAGLVLLRPTPTFKLSLPIKLFEYMAAGLPVIASDFELWRPIITEHQCGFVVDPFDTKIISEKILYLKNHPEEARLMGERGRKAALAFYNWETQAEKLMKAYQQLWA